MNEINSQETVLLSDNVINSEDARGYTKCGMSFFQENIPPAFKNIFNVFVRSHGLLVFTMVTPNLASCVRGQYGFAFHN